MDENTSLIEDKTEKVNICFFSEKSIYVIKLYYV